MNLFNNNEIGYIFNGDCINISKLIDKKSIDLIIADPPYYKIANKKDAKWDYEWTSVEEYIDWSKKYILSFKDILKDNGSFYLWGAIGYNLGYALPKLADWMESEKHFRVINWITQKNTHGCGMKKGFMPCREELLFMVPFKCKSYKIKKMYTNESTNRNDLGSNGKVRKSTTKRFTDVWTDMEFIDNKLESEIFETKNLCSEIWSDISEASQSSNQTFYMNDGTKHPTVKAIRLCDRILNASSEPNDIVFIPFAGTGSEIVSCINNGRKFIAIEISKNYIEEIILKRLNTECNSISIYNDLGSYKIISKS